MMAKVVLLPGDGIGPEVLPAGRQDGVGSGHRRVYSRAARRIRPVLPPAGSGLGLAAAPPPG